MKKTIIIFATVAIVIAAVAYALSARSHESASNGSEKFADADELYDCSMTVEDGEPFEARMAKFFEHLFSAGFKRGLSDCDVDVQSYVGVLLAMGVNPDDVVHNEFEAHVADIDPGFVYRRVPEDMLEEFLVGDLAQFTMNFVISGYYAAANSVDAAEYVVEKYGYEGIFNRCKEVYTVQINALR